MKPILLIPFLFILLSCSNKDDFYVGTWDLNKENGVSTVTFSENKKLNWDIIGTRVMDNMDFEAVKLAPNEYSITSSSGDVPVKLILQRLSKNQCIGCNYKSYVDENMIDEVFIARKNQHPMEPIPKPDQEVIILPEDYTGDFFIVYKYLADDQAGEIKIDDKGIGINKGKPDLKQLFNANRIFRFEGQKKNITIANPNDYGNFLNSNIDSLFKDEDILIIQKGFNQSGRAEWNKEHEEEVKNASNIEYFEVKRIKK
ncbi:hypothetical protein ACE1ET_14235 [Saccharicrinis sp. FJH62]|uniref:hypothetical protein n=1 Tax=Saccharicrinis sp. FJH62 TaxID=3344657 RepID=UPI0035D4BCA6